MGWCLPTCLTWAKHSGSTFYCGACFTLDIRLGQLPRGCHHSACSCAATFLPPFVHASLPPFVSNVLAHLDTRRHPLKQRLQQLPVPCSPPPGRRLPAHQPRVFPLEMIVPLVSPSYPSSRPRSAFRLVVKPPSPVGLLFRFPPPRNTVKLIARHSTDAHRFRRRHPLPFPPPILATQAEAGKRASGKARCLPCGL